MTHHHDTLLDTFKVLLINIIGFSITFTNIELVLKIIALLLTISYTSWKWYKDYKKSKIKAQ